MPSDLAARAADILIEAGMEAADARAAAEILVFAQESGIDSHGLIHLPSYVAGISSGALNARPRMQVLGSHRAAAILDADRAPGALAGLRASNEAVVRAKECGAAVVAVRNSAHFGAAGAFAERMASAGVVGLIFSNASPTVAPRGARTALFGTNPIAAGFPRHDGPPILVDFATSAGSRARIRQAAAEGKPIPTNWALDRNGMPTDDAEAALSGTMQALGGEKGAALPLLVELLCVVLSGGRPGSEVLPPQDPSGRGRGVSHLFIAMDAEAFGGPREVMARADRIAALVESAAPADPANPPRIPGVRGARSRALARRDGIVVSRGLSTALTEARAISQRILASA